MRRNKHVEIIMVMILLLIQIVFMLWFCEKKENFYMDEIWTYGLSNSNYEPFINWRSDYVGTWHSPDYYLDYLETHEQTRFNYRSVFYNQTQDVHPPLYYVLMHTVCSCFPNMFSKWFGLFLNVFLFLLSSIILYRLSRDIFPQGMLALLPNCLWGFSIGAVSTVVFIRMYMMLTLFVLLFLYAHTHYIYRNHIELRYLFFCYCVTIGGVLTQYYFLFFAFVLTAFTCLVFFVQKKYQIFLQYGLSVLLGVITAFGIFPSALNHLFVGYRGEEAVSNISNMSRLKSQIDGYISIVSSQLLGSKKIVILFYLGVLVLAIYLFNKLVCKFRVSNVSEYHIIIEASWWPASQTRISINETAVSTYALFISTIGYFVMVALVSPDITSRYIYCCYPLVALIICIVFSWIFNRIHITYRIKGLLAYGLVFVLLFIGFKIQTPEYLFPGGIHANQIAKQYSEKNAIYISNELIWESVAKIEELSNYNLSMIVLESDIESALSQAKYQIESNNEFIIYVQDNNKTDDNLAAAMQALGLLNYEELYRYYGAVAYYIT